ncbi:putative WD repeat domain-containing protein 83 [Apostichopus japonicus]|uniref:WD repeat domain-containing protein 83 n=1 Tax=Stichopus japonicus TaxID=307972 RepID=A0A2G8L676_STIJA|nr:putative WD repeat domain-containing protein 83 [Apostichopus japonicus]
MASLPTKVTQTLDCKQRAVRAVRFNADGNYCMTCGSDKSVKLWNPHNGLPLKTYVGHGYDVFDAKSSVDNAHLCSCGADKQIILWDVATGQILRKFRGSIDACVYAWDCRSRKNAPVQALNEAKDSVSSIQISDTEILTGSVDKYIRRYDVRNGKMTADCIGQPVTSINFTKDGQCTLVSSLDGKLRLLDKDTGELLGEYTGHQNTQYVIDNCLNEKDTHVISGSEDGKIYFWDLIEGSITTTDKAGPGAVHSISFHPLESCMLSASETQVHVWREPSYQTES